MAYKYDRIATTQRGKIIYPRKKNPFRPSDLRRLIKKLDYPMNNAEKGKWILALQDMLEKALRINDRNTRRIIHELQASLNRYVRNNWELLGFSGGEFGGGGASGTFLLPLGE